MPHADDKLLEAADAYESEKARWGTRHNKRVSRWEVFRKDDDGEPVVQASATGLATIEYEADERKSIAAMKAALSELENAR